ncbi:MAG: hypothetical protein LBV74_14715 [Tannerella sp.]|jgi:YVTN family beta-propeller protein|nr:hypothetical protein [Tannerella sp.]
MNKKFFTQVALCATMILPVFTSCSDDDEPTPEPVVSAEYVYVLNCGDMGSNNTSLSMYNIEDGTVTKDIFEVQNGRRLGDMGQDIVVSGSQIFIAMYGESTVEVTDLEAKSIKQIKTDGQPRALVADRGKIYVTYFNGYVARIDTASLEVEAKVQVGRNPERITVANNKLYVANSGGMDYNTEVGYDKTISVIDITSFTEIKKIEVIINPDNVVSDNNSGVYVISKGNYNMGNPPVPNTLQKIDVNTDEVSVVTNATMMTMAGNTLYYIYSQWGEDGEEIMYYTYNTTNSSIVSENFIGDTKISGPYQINYDASYEHLFITTSDYRNDGDVYMFDKSNNFVKTFEVGMNPMKAVYVKK